MPSFVQLVAMTCVSTLFICLTLMYVRRYILRILLSYRGWMYEGVRKQSKKTLLWGLCVRFVSGFKPSLYSCQKSLPRQPVPTLSHTINKLLESLKVICTEEQYKTYEQQAREFEKGPGKTLQRILVLRSWFVSNYVTNWWEKYVYLMNRSPLPNNSNYYCLDQCHWIPCSNQASRAATLLYYVMVFKRSIDREELSPLLIYDTVPVCMQQYERIFSSTRIPRENRDESRHYDSKHIVVICRGRFYKMDICDENNQLIFPKNLQVQFQYILDNSEPDGVSIDERFLANLTALGRNDWANIRQTHLRSFEPNRASLHIIESAIMSFTLSDYVPTDMSDKGQFLLNGQASGSHWFDKSYSLIIFGDGQAGFHAEHSMADAPALAHLWEYTITKEALLRVYTEDGDCMPHTANLKQAHFELPLKLKWHITEQLKLDIHRATKQSEKNNEDLDLCINDHDTWGKGVMKTHGISPDAFIQIALQLAYYRDSNQQLAHTYEASMTRLYLNGRTETIRSLTELAGQFIKSMDEETVSSADKLRLLRQAAAVHQTNYRDAMNGLGIDRHLFTMLVLSRGLGYDTEFLTSVLTMPWTLSTSQQPQQQQKDYHNANAKHFWNKVCPGGGFGPTCTNGYGVSYMVPRDGTIFFHVTSWRSSTVTDSKRYMRNLDQAMDDMKQLLELGETNNNSNIIPTN